VAQLCGLLCSNLLVRFRFEIFNAAELTSATLEERISGGLLEDLLACGHHVCSFELFQAAAAAAAAALLGNLNHHLLDIRSPFNSNICR